MKIATIAVMGTLMLALGSHHALAQPGSGNGGGRGMGGMNPEQQVKELITQLDVTPEQEPAFREAMAKVNELRMGAMREMRGGPGQGAPGQGAMRQNGQGGQDDHAGHADQAGNGGAMRQGQGQGQGQGRGMEMMAQRRAEMQKQTEEILSGVLSTAQMAKFRELEETRMQEMMSRRPGAQ